ncbi:MAG: hypothetical protein NXY57DRAFT_907311, partial [Lentinula lateritia]
WFCEAFDYLNVDLGSQYADLFMHWIQFERRHGWKNSHNRAGLDKTHRPAELNKWIRNRRFRRQLLEVDENGLCTPAFGDSVWLWWVSLQPHWRALDSNGVPAAFEEFGDDWSTLNKHGRNGWLGLLACVKWWGQGFDPDGDKKRWHELVADMVKMLNGLDNYMSHNSGNSHSVSMQD